jgi:hypothetical protein
VPVRPRSRITLHPESPERRHINREDVVCSTRRHPTSEHIRHEISPCDLSASARRGLQSLSLVDGRLVRLVRLVGWSVQDKNSFSESAHGSGASH